MSGPEVADAAAIVRLLGQTPAVSAGPRLVSIDGPAGSGKTTLAAAVGSAVTAGGRTAAVLHMDDLYRGWRDTLGADLEGRLLEQVLEPLAAGRATRWQRYDWFAAEFGEWVPLAPPDVLVVEGCGSGARAYAAYRSLLVWVEAPPAHRLARGVARDGAQVLTHWLAWMDNERAHFEREQTRARADLVVRTD